MKGYITQLQHFIDEKDENRAKIIEEAISLSIAEAIKEDIFYTLPTKEIIKIFKISKPLKTEQYIEVINRMLESKGGETALVLNAVEVKDASLEDCIKIISSLKCSQICIRLSETYEENEKLIERDYEFEIKKLKEEIEEFKKIVKREEKKKYGRTVFKPVTEKPSDFESNIHKAAENGKLTSVQYLIEQCHANVEEKDNDGCAPLHYASYKGHIEVVKYLIEQCHANVEAKDNYGCAPLHYASENGHIEVVKYLIEQCHANVEEKNNDGWTPLYYAYGKTKEYLQSFVRS